MRPYILAESTWRTVAATPYEVAVLPWGATEAHNYHLPYGTDTMLAEHVATESARVAWERGARVIVLPAIAYGVQTTQLDLKLCLNLNPSTQAAVLGDLVASLEAQGIRRLVLLNAHGGNDFRQIVRELVPRTSVLLCVVDWWKVIPGEGRFEDLGDHAGELETSAMQHVAPALVRPLEEAGAGRERKPVVRALRERWAWTPRRWSQVTSDTGIGDPRAATREKGEAFVQDAIEKIAGFLVELAAVDPARLYEPATE